MSVRTLAAGGCGRSRWVGRLLWIFRGTSRRLIPITLIGFLHNDTLQVLAVLFLEILDRGVFIGGMLQMLLEEL
jgi:hypothetical protein